MTESEYDVVVVGGGVIGSIAARELAPDRDVLVLEADQVAAHATGRSAGIVAPTVFYGDHPELARHANEAFRTFDGTGQFTFTERARVELTAPDQLAEVKVERLRGEGFPVQFLEPDEIEETYPDVKTDRFAGGIEFADTGWVDPYSYAVELANDAERLGADVRTGVRVTGINAADGEITGVETEDGTVTADTVVVAAGWRTRELVDEYLDLPLRPYRTQCIVLDPGRDLSERLPVGRATSEELYFRPEHNGDVLFGGFSAPIQRPESASANADEEFRLAVAQKVPDLFYGFEDAEFVNGWAGIDAASPDGSPIVDAPASVPDGLVVATGFTGIGVMTAPIAARAVHAAVTGEDADLPVDIFELDRFENHSSEFEFVSTFDH